jgi:predicted AlkP superfamily phosphohydrolase/phosphomutase
MSAKRKVMVLGVDGADYAYYKRWMEKGLLPNFAKLAERGRMGILESTYPPVTAPAWISMMTGEAPGSHGIVGWSAPSSANGEYVRKIVNSTSIESPVLWEIASRKDSRCIVVNVPLTYPVRAINGILVSGMPTPDGSGFTHPQEYELELRLVQPDYAIDLAWQEYKFRGHDLVNDEKEMTRARTELCLKLLEAKPWDFFMVVFTGTDRLQHCLHSHVMRIDDNEAVRSDALTAAVRDYFVTLDTWIGDIMQAAGSDTNFIVVSDHGFGPLDSVVYFSKWLVDEGLLVLKPKAQSGSLKHWKKAMNAVGIRRSTLRGLVRSVGLEKVAHNRIERLNPYVGGIDWERTKVHYYPTNGFYVNLRGRDMFGCVEPGDEYEAVRTDLIERLERLKDPRTGERLIPLVKRREEIFAGRNLHRLPDVFIEFLDRPYESFMYDYDVPSMFVKPEWADGTHRRNGLYIGAGPALAQGGTVEGLEIFDIAPNVLHLLGVAIPEHMDGRFRADLFTREGAADVQFESIGGRSTERYGISADEERDLEEKLRGLGYM